MIEVCKCASTKLCVSSGRAESGNVAETYAAVGASDGFIHVVGLKDLNVRLSSACHDFPVTGILFQPTEVSSSGGIYTYTHIYSILVYGYLFF